MNVKGSKPILPSSSLRYVLESLVPYTEANLKLTFKPGAFFADLEKIDRQRQWRRGRDSRQFTYESIRQAFYRAQKRGLITINDGGNPLLTEKGRLHTALYQPKLLGSSARLIVIFDIPENERGKRDHLRRLLRELKFEQVQQSVWATKYDYRDLLKSEISGAKLETYVQVYEAAQLF